MNIRNLQDWELRTIPYKFYNYQSKKNARYHRRIRDQGPKTQKLKKKILSPPTVQHVLDSKYAVSIQIMLLGMHEVLGIGIDVVT